MLGVILNRGLAFFQIGSIGIDRDFKIMLLIVRDYDI
jgi:hypothetical protein